MTHRYLVDGYNLIHRESPYREHAAADLEGARNALIDYVARFCALSGQEATVVFDGRGPRAEREKNAPGVPGLEVVYAPRRTSADAFIEREVYNSPARERTVVVSGDRGIRDLCIGLGALAMDPGNFLDVSGDTHLEATDGRSARDEVTMGLVEDRLDAVSLAVLKKGLIK